MASFELVGDFFYEYLLAVLLEKGGQPVGPFADLEGSSGLRQAVWRSLRGIYWKRKLEPHLAFRAVEEGLFDEIAVTRLAGLLNLQEAIGNLSRQLGGGIAGRFGQFGHSLGGGLTVSCQIFDGHLLRFLRHHASSAFVVRRSGSYQFRGRCSFPLPINSAYQFAERFVDRHLLKAGVVYQPLQVRHEPFELGNRAVATPSVRVGHVIGGRGTGFHLQSHSTCGGNDRAYVSSIGVVAEDSSRMGYFRRVFLRASNSLLHHSDAPLFWKNRSPSFGGCLPLEEKTIPWQALFDVLRTFSLSKPVEQRLFTP